MKQWGAVWVQERLLTDLQPLFSFVYHQQPFSPETSRWEKNLDRTSNRSCRQTTTTNNH
ncbi:hypothetical protein JW992_07805 [candidate division KSB1 bacterium]|nr:hypothetical protein [candidate division KSB1 bacterium]